MIALLIENMAPLMFVALVVFLLLGYPVAFALAANGLLFGFIAIELGLFSPNFFQAMPERVFGIMANDTLLAIPFFTFMGLILERSGMAEDLLDTIGQLFGPLRGGLAYAVIFVGALLAATTGVVAASVISMGLISLPIMLRYGYDRRLAGGAIAASGTLAQIIPPSLVLIVLADQLGRSVGDMYKGAFIPGFILTGMYVLYVVDYHHLKYFGTPQYDPLANQYFHDTIGRLTRYRVQEVGGVTTVDPATRTVLIGATMQSGFPIVHQSHGIGSLVFGEDGTLLVSCGDGASYSTVDTGGPIGGSSNTGLADGILTPEEDVGAFRSQMLESLNGKVLQDGTTADMVFPADEIVAAVSAAAPLEPGDLILTGTPAGVGVFRDPPVFLRPGDHLECAIHGIGALQLPIEPAPP